jgi:hypothetical protein
VEWNSVLYPEGDRPVDDASVKDAEGESGSERRFEKIV